MSRRGIVRAAAIALLGAMLPAIPADAHAFLVRSTPAHRAVLGQVPERVQLWFNERLEPAYSTVSVWSEGGTQVDGRDVTVGTNDPRRLSVSIEARGSGVYTVKYRVLSVDGHVVDSQLTFTVKGTRS
ncbi:MAG TPA: copper resistance CopC family protein [Methylomirabilota bacterium]|nr:copper resistance CopC family protein [Methylomirabilota bacterium]